MKHLDLLATYDDLNHFQRLLAEELTTVSFSDDGKEKVRDVVREFYTNLIEYAYPETSDSSEIAELWDDQFAKITESAKVAPNEQTDERTLSTSWKASIGSIQSEEDSNSTGNLNALWADVRETDVQGTSETDSNVARPVGIDYSIRSGRISLRFADRGVPFNLLEYTPPMMDVDGDERMTDSELADSERSDSGANSVDERDDFGSDGLFSDVFAGGLGIELIRSLTDVLTYRYENGWNLVDLVILDT